MARTDNFTNFATDVADSIREMTGKTNKIPAANFDTEIKSINVGTSENLTDELNTYDTNLTTQETTLEDIVKALQGKASGGGSTEPVVEPDYITDGLVAWWEGEDGFDENVHWNSRVGDDYISVINYNYGGPTTNPPIAAGGAVYNTGTHAFTTQQDYCIEGYTIQAVGRLDSSLNTNGNTMSMLVGMNMSASPMIGISSNGNAMFANGDNIVHELRYPITSKVFNGSLNLSNAPVRGAASALNLSYSVNGDSWKTATTSSATHTSKGNNMTVLCYYTATYRSCGARLYSLRVYNRKLTEEELQYNYEIDKARFEIEELEG